MNNRLVLFIVIVLAVLWLSPTQCNFPLLPSIVTPKRILPVIPRPVPRVPREEPTPAPTPGPTPGTGIVPPVEPGSKPDVAPIVPGPAAPLTEPAVPLAQPVVAKQAPTAKYAPARSYGSRILRWRR